MPAAIIDGRLQTKCEVCGCTASFGDESHLTKAMQAKAAGNISAAKHLLGKWYCGFRDGKPCCKSIEAAEQEAKHEQEKTRQAT